MSFHLTELIAPLRTAQEQLETAGVESFVFAQSAVDGSGTRQDLYYVAGKGGTCAMLETEWIRYQSLCERWSSNPLDLEGAPGVSMIQATADEDSESLPPGNPRPPAATALNTELRQIRELLQSAQRTLSIDDYGDALAGALARVDVCTRLVAELIKKGGAA